MSYKKYYDEEYKALTESLEEELQDLIEEGAFKSRFSTVGLEQYKERRVKRIEDKAHTKAMSKIKRDMEQGFQGWEYKFNTVASSRGDYPFITMTIGLGTSKLERLASITMLKVRGNGQGKPGRKIPVLFPKIVLLYDSKLHGEGKVSRDVYEAGIDCSSKAMYPDWLSLEPGSYVGDMYQKYGKVISPMGKWKYAAHVKRLEPCA